MEVTETLSEGLKREFQVQVPAADLEARVVERLGELKDRVQLRGFRPGKVPVTHLRKIYGKAVMAETIEAVIREFNAKIVSERGLKLAMEPKVTIPNEDTAVEKVIASLGDSVELLGFGEALHGGKDILILRNRLFQRLVEVIGGQSDLAYTLALEILPKIELADFKGMKLERQVAEVTDAQLNEAIERIAEQNRPFAAKPEGAKAEKGDRVVIDFAGRIDGAAFEGGTGGDVGVNIGGGTFLPGFEDQLIGMGPGETRVVKITFPENYANAQLAGKNAEFDVTVKSLEAPGKVTIDDAFAKSLGLESLEKLKDAVKGRLQQEHAALSRQLLDRLDEMHQFALPPTLAEDEFKNVWSTVENDLKAQGRTFADEGTTEEKAREEYRGIAERRVRLGLVLAEIGEKNKISVTEDEITRAIVERARQLPGREQEIWEYYRKNPAAVAAVRAPMFEEKVVDFLIELATVSEKQVSREDLLKDEEDEKSGAG